MNEQRDYDKYSVRFKRGHMTTRQKLLLVDGSNHFHRAYNAASDLTAPDGFPTGALHGFFQIIQSVEKLEKPDYAVIVFDKGKSFRSELFEEYKGNRVEKSSDFKKQWQEIVSLCQACGYPVYAKDDGFEADDIVGTLAEKFKSEVDVVIFSADKDFAQLVDDHVTLLVPNMKMGTLKKYNKAEIEAKYKVPVKYLVDYFAMVGDTSDNIPGIHGIGPGFAAKYIEQYGSWADVLANAANIIGKKGEVIAESAALMEQGIQLITIARHVDLDWSLADCLIRPFNNDVLYEKTVRFGLKVLSRNYSLEAPKVATFESIHHIHRLSDFQEKVLQDNLKSIVIQPIFSSDDIMERALLGIGISMDAGDLYLVHLGSNKMPEPDLGGLFASSMEAVFDHELFDAVWQFLLNDDICKWGYDFKQLFAFALQFKKTLFHNFEDILLLDYVDQRFINHRQRSFSDIARRLGLVEIPDQIDEDHGVEDVAIAQCAAIWMVKDAFMITDSMRKVLTDIEYPTVSILAEMELNGIRLDTSEFATFEDVIAEQLGEIETEIEEKIGEKVNLRSPKQVSDLLYTKRGHKPVKKTKSGGSTDSASLQKLMETSEDWILPKILEYREIHKISSTYLESLPQFIRQDGRIHTKLHQAITATGRLSSSDPNLQNIPVRKAWGQKIRKCFVPSSDKVLISADYSQIEMRILAHYCKEGPLVEAFLNNEDIHERTGKEIAGGDLFYTKEMRTIAKSINYGLIYGMSSFRLSRELGISREDAQKYITAYFERYPQVSQYLESSVKDAQETGLAQTLFGRQRPILNINNKENSKREAAERIALNAPIQGTAADIMKMAMINVAHRLHKEFPKAQLLLQVHDELVLESDTCDAQAISVLLKEEMEQVVSLCVPLVAQVAIGQNWNDIH